ncbi:hypothetical protein BYT27DRAFT_7200321 [Phlegmacium glaucopus]|nr:hypothetical protein BYT27DRAFT_7200321 [Phlegmacium glaucopus]
MATQTQPEVFPSIHLRPALNSGKNTALATTLAAFSPDIIPLDQVKATPAQLVSSYSYFVAHTIDLDEPGTLIYVRGKQHDESQVIASLRAVPNELVLWPQLWGSANVIGQIGFKLDSTINHKQVAVGVAPILYSPIPISDQDHSHATLIATCAAPNEEFSVPSVENWRDLVEHVGKNTSLAFYNVQAADPCSRQTNLTTKFRLIENEAASVELFFGLETTGIPTSGVDASLNVVGKNADGTVFSFTIDRQPLSQTGVYGKHVKVLSGFEGNVILEVFNEDLNVFGDYSSISIVVYAVDSAGEVLLGAEHLVFDSNPRVKKLARTYNPNIFSTQEVQAAESILPSPFPFYFRDTLTDDGTFPKIGNSAYSPDIQPLGTVQDSNPAVTLGDFTVDLSDQRKIGLESNTSNYIYLRGIATAPFSGQTRLFYVTGSILLHPNLYSQTSHIVYDIDSNGNPVVAYRPFQTNSAGQIVITRPFTLDNLAPPSQNGGDHYCLVAEALPDGVQKWPHELVDLFSTSAEFVTWIVNQPYVAWRNVAYVVNPNPDDQTIQTSFTIPPGFSSSDQWQFQVQASKCPVGSSFSVTSDDPDIQFPDTPVQTDPTIATSAFTGKPSGYTAQVTIHYHAHGHPTQSGQSLNAVLIQIVPLTGLLAQVAAASPVADVTATLTKNTVTHVGEAYPNLVDPEAPKDGRLRIGGAIRARSLGEAHDDPYDSVIPILRGIVVGTDRLRF